MFNLTLGIERIEGKEINIIKREAVRAIILNDNKILMVLTNKGDYKFPGGGVKKGESDQDVVVREVKEEVGYIVNKVCDKVGEIIERKIDEYEENSIFQMTSIYYLAEESNQELDKYEAELEFKAKWITINDAIKNNEDNLKKEDINPWVLRETLALKEIQNKLNHIVKTSC